MTLRDAAAKPLVHIQNLRMDLGKTTVTKDLSFDVRAGESFAFLCSNGSRKTTTLRMLLALRLAVHLFRYWFTGYGRKRSVEGTFCPKEPAAK